MFQRHMIQIRFQNSCFVNTYRSSSIRRVANQVENPASLLVLLSLIKSLILLTYFNLISFPLKLLESSALKKMRDLKFLKRDQLKYWHVESTKFWV